MPEGVTPAERTRLERRATSDGMIQPPRGSRASRPRKRQLLRWTLILGAAIGLLIGGLIYWVNGGQYISTDDAFVQADVLNVATDVSGIVEAIPVRDGERVEKGQVLFTLDPLKFQLAVDEATANLNQAMLDLEALKAEAVRAQRLQAAQEAIVRNDQDTVNRYAALVKQHAVTELQYQNALFKLKADQAQLGSSAAQVKSSLAKLGGALSTPIEDMPPYKQAKARLGEMQRRMRHSVVRAPFDGVVTRVPKLQLGQYLPAGTPAFGLVGDNFWIEAQPKETSLTHAREGDPATVTIDAFPGITWHGTVRSIAPATHQEFSVLPAQNSSGNWVKVVQRVPIIVTLNPIKNGPPLSAGMSAEVTINTHHHRHLGDLFSDLL